VLTEAARLGFDSDEILRDLAATVPPKALSTNLGMLEILGEGADETTRLWRIAAVVHITDMDVADDVLRRLDRLPAGYDLIVTTSDGLRAARIRGWLETWTTPRFASWQVRVTPASRGRDMSDFFIACRDILLSDRYDLIVKVHARPASRKTGLVRHYFRRYQLENLLDSDAYVARLLALFEREAGLGVVFPPMMHIGYQTMGRAWAGLRESAEHLSAILGLRVPLDMVSPLAPFGAMFIARPAALRPLAEKAWTYRDYEHASGRKYTDLARLQERVIVPAAGQAGFHARMVMTHEHAEISHTALEFKVDQMFSTTPGYPVDQINLVQRAGWTGYGGIVGLSRMYLRLNHPRLAVALLPVMSVAERAYRVLGPRTRMVRFPRLRRKESR
jgi:lipopolysaccharide biosynthesis protein